MWKRKKKNKPAPKNNESAKRKTVEYGGKTYVITARKYGYTHQAMEVNGEATSIHLRNDSLLNPLEWKRYAIQAINEHETCKRAEQEFKDWDGKL